MSGYTIACAFKNQFALLNLFAWTVKRSRILKSALNCYISNNYFCIVLNLHSYFAETTGTVMFFASKSSPIFRAFANIYVYLRDKKIVTILK